MDTWLNGVVSGVLGVEGFLFDLHAGNGALVYEKVDVGLMISASSECAFLVTAR